MRMLSLVGVIIAKGSRCTEILAARMPHAIRALTLGNDISKLIHNGFDLRDLNFNYTTKTIMKKI